MSPALVVALAGWGNITDTRDRLLFAGVMYAVIGLYVLVSPAFSRLRGWTEQVALGLAFVIMGVALVLAREHLPEAALALPLVMVALISVWTWLRNRKR